LLKNLFRMEWAKHFPKMQYYVTFRWHKWKKPLFLEISAELLEFSDIACVSFMENIEALGLIELTEQEKHDKLLYEKQKAWIEEQQKNGGFGDVKYEDALKHFSDSKWLTAIEAKKAADKVYVNKFAEIYGIPEDVLAEQVEDKLKSKFYQQFKDVEDPEKLVGTNWIWKATKSGTYQIENPPLTQKTKQQWSDSGHKLVQVVPGLRHRVMDGCPHPGCGEMQDYILENVIIHLNDKHKWPRSAEDKNPLNAPNNIADWVEEYAIEMHLDMTFHTVSEMEAEREYPPF